MVTHSSPALGATVDLDRLAASVAADVGEPPERVRPVVERIVRLVLEPVDDGAATEVVAADGEHAAREGLLPEQLLDRYLSTLWAVWEVRAAGIAERADLIAFADRLLRTADALVAAVAVGYRAVERELIVNNAEARRAFIDELLGTVAVDPTAVGRLRRLSARNGLEPTATYRLIALAGATIDDDEMAEELAAQSRRLMTGPGSVDRAQAGVALPQAIAWRGRVVILARATWPGLARLRTGLEAAEFEWTAVQTSSVKTVESLAPALARLLDTLRTAHRLGRRGWIEHADDLAVERLLLADDSLLATVVEKELGPIIADARMGDELIHTLRAYFDSGENIRETARRLHLADRTVAYRLARIETLLGQPLDGERRQRLVIALLARRILLHAD
jgi:PucR C-terminal helix-turn-helix domain